jgi:hypothetical protein
LEREGVLILCEFCTAHIGQDFAAEDIRAFAEANGVARLKDARAWGLVLERAEKLGVIKNVGYAPSFSSNGSPKVLWRMVGADSE